MNVNINISGWFLTSSLDMTLMCFFLCVVVSLFFDRLQGVIQLRFSKVNEVPTNSDDAGKYLFEIIPRKHEINPETGAEVTLAVVWHLEAVLCAAVIHQNCLWWSSLEIFL